MSLQILQRDGEYVYFTAESVSVNGKPSILLTCKNCAWETFSHDEMAEHKCKQKREKVKNHE